MKLHVKRTSKLKIIFSSELFEQFFYFIYIGVIFKFELKIGFPIFS